MLRAETGQGPRLESQDDIGYLIGQHRADDYERQIRMPERSMPPADSSRQESLAVGRTER